MRPFSQVPCTAGPCPAEAVFLAACLSLFFLAPLSAATLPSDFPVANESLHYNLVWPSGISLGEASLTATRVPQGWTFDLRVNASLPWYEIADHYSSSVNDDLCSTSFERETAHGARKTNEKIAIPPAGGEAVRETTGGGKSRIAVAPCSHDPLALLYATRRALARGQLPPAQTVVFGRGYPVSFQSSAPGHVTCTFKDSRIEVSFNSDAARTPMKLSAPFPIGTFSVELAH